MKCYNLLVEKKSNDKNKSFFFFIGRLFKSFYFVVVNYFEINEELYNMVYFLVGVYKVELRFIDC